MNGPLIVVVEDDECIRTSIAEILEMEGYQVLAFPNGLEATKALEGRAQPCVILLDWMMPIMGGEAFLKARENLGDTCLQIPVIVLSAVSERACGKPGVKTCLGKPVDLNRLLDAVGSLCHGRQCA
jgi:CheY-like chemotaxis protein